MEEWQQRVITEKEQLDARLRKLRAFTDTPAFADLPAEDRRLLAEQEEAMLLYAAVLQRRVKRFSP